MGEAPKDGKYYGRYNATWQKVMPLDIMELPAF